MNRAASHPSFSFGSSSTGGICAFAPGRGPRRYLSAWSRQVLFVRRLQQEWFLFPCASHILYALPQAFAAQSLPCRRSPPRTTPAPWWTSRCRRTSLPPPAARPCSSPPRRVMAENDGHHVLVQVLVDAVHDRLRLARQVGRRGQRLLGVAVPGAGHLEGVPGVQLPLLSLPHRESSVTRSRSVMSSSARNRCSGDPLGYAPRRRQHREARQGLVQRSNLPGSVRRRLP